VDKYLLICALVIAVVGAAHDVRDARIPNWLTYRGLIAAFAVRVVLLGWPGLRSGFVGMLVAGGVFYLLFLLGGMGGGDVKLMAVVAAWGGGSQAVPILITAAIAGGILAVAYMTAGKRVRQTLLNTLELIRHHMLSGLRPHARLNVRQPSTTRVPYGVAIAMATLYCAGNAFWRR